MRLKKRDYGGHDGLGDKRWERYSEAFDRVEQCLGSRHYLEAIALLDSLLWERLGSRLSFLRLKFPKGNLQPDMLPPNIGPICTEMVGEDPEANGYKGIEKDKYNGIEKDEKFQPVIRNIQRWAKERNEAMHATSQVFRDETSDKDLQQILSRHGRTVESGIMLLRAFDDLDTESRNNVGKTPATQPDAFYPERRRNNPYPRKIWGNGPS